MNPAKPPAITPAEHPIETLGLIGWEYRLAVAFQGRGPLMGICITRG